MTDDDILLAELMCTRLCHDLAGPIGGAAAGVELLAEESGGLPVEVASLLGASVTVASRHLRFLRAALGSGGPDTAPAMLRGLAEDYLAPPPGQAATHRVTWRDEAPDAGAWSKAHGKLVLNLVMTARDLLPMGGHVEVQVDRGTPWSVTATVRGRLRADEVTAGLDCVEGTELSPRAAQAYFAQRLAGSLAAAIGWTRLAEDVMQLCAAPN